MRADPLVYKSITTVQALPSVETHELFKQGAAALLSPIDQFITNTSAINQVYVPFYAQQQNWQTELGTLVVLGYMSAIESYFRAVVSGLIQIDETTRRLAGPRSVSFAAATHSAKETVLTEALLEHISFATAGEIEKVLKDIVGLKPQLPSEIKAVLSEFRKFCELRHCCVHRFGKLGSQNALSLGYERHRVKIEHPFAPSIQDVESIADALQIIVKTLNNFIFTSVIDRAVMVGFDGSSDLRWTWAYRSDRKRFKAYYDLFAVIHGAPRSPDLRSTYASFRAQHSAMVRARNHRQPAATGG